MMRPSRFFMIKNRVKSGIINLISSQDSAIRVLDVQRLQINIKHKPPANFSWESEKFCQSAHHNPSSRHLLSSTILSSSSQEWTDIYPNTAESTSTL